MKTALKRIGKWFLAIVGLVLLLSILSPVMALLLRIVFKVVVKE